MVLLIILITLILVLFLKLKNYNTLSDFRPINICNVIMKVLTKTIANKIKSFLFMVILDQQSAFYPGRLITNNTLLAYVVFHYTDKVQRGK
jgi:hypothetical protein